MESVGRRLWRVALTGVPFATFKIGGGIAAYFDIHTGLGAAIVAWGVVDLSLNLASLPWPRHVAVCLLSNIGRRIDRRSSRQGWEPVFLAIDTLLSFGIVATMIWFGRTDTLPAPLPRIWGVAVIASVLGVGIERVWTCVRELRASG